MSICLSTEEDLNWWTTFYIRHQAATQYQILSLWIIFLYFE